MPDNQGAAAAALAGDTGGQQQGSQQQSQQGQQQQQGQVQQQQQQASNDAWYAKFAPEMIGRLEKKGWASPDGMEKALGSYFELEKAFHAADKLPFPKDPDADPKAMDAVYTRLGRPESPDKYQFPEGVDAETVKSLAPELHKIGITQKQAQALATIDIQRQQRAMQAAQDKSVADQNAADAKLKSEWGDKYAANMEMARRAMRNIGMTVDESVAMMTAVGAEKVLRLLNFAGASVKEDNAAGLGESQLGFGMTPNRAKAELAEKGRDLLTRARAGDKTAHAEYTRLHRVAAGE